MTREIIETLRVCADADILCTACPRYEQYEYGRTIRCMNDLMQEAADALEAAIREQEKRRWIPVTERMPQEDMPFGAVCDIVQVILDGGVVTVGFCNRGLGVWYYLPKDGFFFVGNSYAKSPVKAWKQLSEPPKEDAP